jgi:hypothetical protein
LTVAVVVAFAGAGAAQHLQQPPAIAALASSLRSIFCISVTSLLTGYFHFAQNDIHIRATRIIARHFFNIKRHDLYLHFTRVLKNQIIGCIHLTNPSFVISGRLQATPGARRRITPRAGDARQSNRDRRFTRQERIKKGLAVFAG